MTSTFAQRHNSMSVLVTLQFSLVRWTTLWNRRNTSVTAEHFQLVVREFGSDIVKERTWEIAGEDNQEVPFAGCNIPHFVLELRIGILEFVRLSGLKLKIVGGRAWGTRIPTMYA